MKKLRTSRAAKTAAFLLLLVCCSACLLNAAGVFFALDQNLINVDRTPFNEKIFSLVARATADEAVRYYNLQYAAEHSAVDRPYYESEVALFRSRYSEARSNAAIYIMGPDGETVFKSFELARPAYVFDRAFSPDYYTEEASSYYEGAPGETVPFEETTAGFAGEAPTEAQTETPGEGQTEMPAAGPADETAPATEETAFTAPVPTAAEVSSPPKASFLSTMEAGSYTVSVRLPETMEKKDVYRAAEKVSGLLYACLQAAVPMAVLFALLGVLCFVFLLWSAGYTKAAEAPVCGGWHRLPFDLSLLLFIAAELFMVFLAFSILDSSLPGQLSAAMLPPIVGAAALFFESLAVRLRTKTVWKSTLTRRLLRLIKRAAAAVSRNTDLAWKLGAYYALSFVAVFAAIAIAIFHDDAELMLIPYGLFKIAELAFFIVVIVNVRALRDGTKRILRGETGTPIAHRLLFGEFRRMAEDLNAVDQGVQAAVAERMKSERMKTELITNVSHDLKTPLTSIVSYIGLLRQRPVEDPEALEYIEVIDRQAQRLKKLTADVVEASKAASGAIQVMMEPTDVGMLLGQAAGEYRERMTGAGLTQVTELPDSPLTVSADGKLLWRVLDNLLGNALKYAAPGTRVYISAKQENGGAAVILRNVSAAPLNVSPEELTERFVRGDASRGSEGTGLGLSIAKSLTELMGGSFTVEIDGDLFKVTLRFPSAAAK